MPPDPSPGPARHSRRRVIAGGLSLLALPIAACGGNGDSDGQVKLTIITPVGEPTVPPAQATKIPPPEVILSTEDVFQAGAILVSLTGEISGGTLKALGRSLPLTKGARSYFTFVPVDALDPPGPQTMTIEFTTSNGSKGSLSQPFTILETDWTRDSLSFTPEQVNRLLDPQVQASELSQLRSIYEQVTPEKFWDGNFRVPLDAPLTARYGEERSVNGGPFTGHHSGTDLGAVQGTPVMATNAGKIVLARQMTVRGNFVIVDHGGGLHSGYAHMSSFGVAEGQFVAAGDTIGFVGNTGLSTAAHLHWEMSQGGVLLDALRFADGTNGF